MRDMKENDIAIIGYAFDFPEGTDSDEKFWKVLKNGEDLVREIPKNRWDWKKIYDPDPNAKGKSYSYYGAFLNDIEQFDANAFRIMPVEAKELDPQQRLVLKTSWRALENSYLNIEQLKHSDTGVFIGATMDDYLQLQTRVDCGKHIGRYTHFGSVLNDISGRVSYVYGFHGPSMTIDTACSSSMTALDSAIKALKDGDCEIALAGGVNVILTEELYIKFSRTQMLSKTGACKTFDDSADGYVRGEGCGILILQKLRDAIKSKKHIIAVIKGISINHNGNSGGLTVPSGKAQVMLIQNCMKKAGVEPNEIDYIEAHGTGTQLGDKIEVNSLQEVFKDRKKTLLIGSVKTNIGHLESAAGVAGIIKVLLCMENNEFVPSIHLENKNKKINWDNSPVDVVQDNIKWLSDTKIAGISSFGASGTNGHLIIQKYDNERTEDQTEVAGNLYLAVSAKSIESLRKILVSINNSLADKKRDEIQKFCSVYNLVRSDYIYRVVVCGADVEEFKNNIINKIEHISELSTKGEMSEKCCVFNIDYDLGAYKRFDENNEAYSSCVGEIKEKLSDISIEKEKIIMGIALYKYITKIGLKKYSIVGDNYTKFLLLLSTKNINEYDYYVKRYLEKEQSLIKELDEFICDNYICSVLEMKGDNDIHEILLEKAAKQYEHQANIKWECFYSVQSNNMPVLPGYEFDEQYYWSDYHRHVENDLKENRFLDNFISYYKEEESENEHTFTIKLRKSADYIEQHRIYQKEVLIGTFQVMLINEIAEQIFGHDFAISELFYMQKINPSKEHTLRVVIQKNDNEGKIIEQDNNGEWITKTIFNISLKKGSRDNKVDTTEIVGEFIEKDDFYNKLSCGGLNLGSDYQIMNTIVKSNQCSIALLDKADLIPAVLDSASQLLYLYRDSENDLYMPYYFSSFEQWESIENVNRVEEKIINKTEDELVAELTYYDDDRLIARFDNYHLKLVEKEKVNILDSILGERAKMPDGTDLYQYIIKVTGTSLHDHVVYNQLTIPGAYFITQIMQFAEKEFQHEQFEISNISFYNAMVLEENMLVKEIIQIEQKLNDYEVSICSRNINSDVFVDNVKMTLNDRDEINIPVLEEIIESDKVNGKCISGDEIVKIQWKIGLNLSDTFHWMEEAWIYENSVFAKLSNNSFDVLQSNYGTAPGLIDTAVQILGLYKNVNQETEGAYIPLTINKIIQYQKLKNKLCCAVYNIKEVGELLTADIVYYNPIDNKKVLEFQEISLIKADRSKLVNANSNDTLIVEQEWVETSIDEIVSIQYSNALEIRLGILNEKVIITKYQVNRNEWNIYEKMIFDLEEDSWLEIVLDEISNNKKIIVLSDSSEYISVVEKKAEEVNRICKTITDFYFTVLKQVQRVNIPENVLCFATNQVYAREFEKVNIGASLIWGLVCSLQIELADQNIILYDSDKNSCIRVDSINKCAKNEISQIVDYDGIIKVPRIANPTYDMGPNSVIKFSREKSYIVIGGFGALGLETCKRMVNEGARRLIIIGRSDLEQKKEEINSLYKTNKDLSIEYHQLDISNSSEESRLLEILQNEKVVGGIVYAAGVVRDKIYSNYTDEDIQAVYKSKINGVITLFNVLENIKFDFCACYSSIVSTVGAAGQSVYGAANSFIDSLCNYMNRKGKNIFSIQWGPWAGIGMFSKVDKIAVKRYEARNIFAMNSKEAMDAFLLSLKRNKNQMILRQKKKNKDVIIKKNKYSSSIHKKSREQSVKGQIKEIVANAIGLNDVNQLKSDAGLMDIGIDSLLMIEIRMKINKFFNVNISLDKFFENITIDKLNVIINEK